MVQAISSSSHRSDDNNQSPSNIPLPSSKGSSLVSSAGARLPTPPLKSLTTDLPLVAINYSGASPSTNLPPPSRLKSPSFISPNPRLQASGGRDAVFGSNGLVGLGIGSTSDLVIPSSRNSGLWKVQNLREESEDGSDLGLVNVSPTTYKASPLASPTEEKFAIATQHLRQHSNSIIQPVVFKGGEKQPSLERESSEEVIVVPDLIPREGSAAEQRRRRRRLERRQSATNTPVVSPEVVQRGWVKRM